MASAVKKTVVTVAITLGAAALLGVGVLLFVVFTGAYDVAATQSHAPVTRWALNTLQRSSVAARAGSVGEPPALDSAAVMHGFSHFHAMCVQCHGAPGLDRGELGEGMMPVPPRLEEQAATWTDAELFWITKHGIRLAGMPGFGPTHTDEELWGIVAFLRRLEDMTEVEYGELVRATGAPEAGEGGHSHAPGTPEHSH